MLAGLVYPQFEHITQPDLRDQARTLTATRLADAYASVYTYVCNSKHVGAAPSLHSPHEVRTMLEID